MKKSMILLKVYIFENKKTIKKSGISAFNNSQPICRYICLFLPDKRGHTLSRYEHSRTIVKKCGGACGDNARNAENDK